MFSGYAVVMLGKRHIAVLSDSHQLAFLHSEAPLGQRTQLVFLHTVEHLHS